MSKISLYRNNTLEVNCTIKSGGVAFDLDGYTAVLTVRRNNELGDILFQVIGEIAVPEEGEEPTGEVVFNIEKNQAFEVGIHLYDINITDGTNYFTVVKSEFQIIDTITK